MGGELAHVPVLAQGGSSRPQGRERGLEGRSLLLVDDICTTAETLRACANALVAAEAARVCAVVVAKA